MKLLPDDYAGKPINSCQGQAFKPWDRTGFTVIDVLPQLIGRPWDEVALGFVHALRPSWVRVVTDGTQLDAHAWRVTVWLKKDGKTISRICQEVKVGLAEGCDCGDDMDRVLNEYRDGGAAFAE